MIALDVIIGSARFPHASSLQLPDYMALIINNGVVKSNSGYILSEGLIMVVISLFGAACTVGVGFLASRIATGFSRDVRNKVFAHVESFSLVEFNKFSTASLITRSTNDIQQIQMVMVLLLRMVLQAPITGLWAVVKAYDLAQSLSWIIALAVSILIGVIAVMFTIAMPKFKILQSLVDRLNLVTRENLTGLRVIRAFNNEELEQGKFEKANVNLTAVLIVWIGAHLINSGSLEVGNMIAFMQYAMQVIMSFLMISMIFIMVPRAVVSADRISEVIETEPLIKDASTSSALSSTGSAPRSTSSTSKGVIEFKDVTFKYPGAEDAVIAHISFTAKPGETTAFVGSTGSGKSTLINLIPRFYDVTAGEIIIDGVDVRNYKLEDLYAKIGYVPQKGVLFSGTVESNIKYGSPESSRDDVASFAEVAQATEFIKNLEGNFEAPIAQGGTNVSGGQKQRLAIARAIARCPEIYIFDDSFSALDFKTDAKLRQALKSETHDKTVLIVAQRIATILNAEKIIVLEEGKIVGMGIHRELLKNCEVYREIAYSQLSAEELSNYQLKVSQEK